MLSLVALAFALPSSTIVQEVVSAPPLTDLVERTIDADAQSLVANGLVPGMVVGVIRGDERCVRSFGELALGSGKTPDEWTVYEIGSVSKVFTGVLLADAEQREVLSIDASVQSFYPTDFELDQVGDAPIRLRDLTTHSSGLPRMPANFAPADPSNPYADYTFELMYAFLDGCKIRRAPGEQYAYSNLAVGLLGTIIAQAQATDYASLLQDRIAKPLGLTNTGLALTPEMSRRLAPGYTVDQEPQSNWDFIALAGAGGIRSNVHDMLIFAQAALHPEDGPLAKALPRSMEPLYTSPDGVSVAFGWHVASDGATRWHNGQTGGYHSFLAVIPGIDTAVVVLSNTSTGLVDVLGDNLVRVLMGSQARELQYPKAIAVPAEQLTEYVGRYKLNFLASLTVTQQDDRLFAQLTTQPAARIYPSAKDRFFYRAVNAELTFERDEAGKLISVTLLQDGNETTAKRVE